MVHEEVPNVVVYEEYQGGLGLGMDLWRDYVQLEVGDDNRVRFWQDKWCGNQFLKEMYQKLYALAADKGASINTYVKKQNEETTHSWSVMLIRDCFLIGKLHTCPIGLEPTSPSIIIMGEGSVS